MKTEYQGRGTPHWHIACWVISFIVLRFLAGNTGKRVISVFVRFLQLVFCCEIDVQVGNGRLNYINGYVAKDHDAVDVGLGEYVQTGSTAPWLATYRLISKSTPCIPEVAIRMASLPEFERSYVHVLLFPPQPKACESFDDRKVSFSIRMYRVYLQEMKLVAAAGATVNESFLVWHRSRQWDQQSESCVFRGGRHQQLYEKTHVVACRYWYELTDGFWGQFLLTQIPHADVLALRPRGKSLDTMTNFFGMMQYLRSWEWVSADVIKAESCCFSVSSLPMLLSDDGSLVQVGVFSVGAAVFSTDRLAFDYIVALAKRDLQYRGLRDGRVNCFEYKQEANFLLYQRVLRCTDDHEYELCRQSWDTVNRPKYSPKKWSDKQNEVLQYIDDYVSHDDEDAKSKSQRFLYVKGCPGSGKSAVLLEGAIRCAKGGLTVIIVCPTGALVTQVHVFFSFCVAV